MVFARGSSSNQDSKFLDKPFGDAFRDVEKIPGVFFQSIEYILKRDYPHVDYKAVSVHNFPNKYNPRGYPASGIFNYSTANNAINADISWWPLGDYQDSIRDGKEEVEGYVRDEIHRCPAQQIVLGGYSQGAQLIGETLFNFTPTERQNIGAVALFGDPKFHGAGYDNVVSNDGSIVGYPWKRGNSRGGTVSLAEPRIPYLPDDMTRKTISWCFDDDFVCSGVTGTRLRKLNIKADNSAGHTRYEYFGASQAAQEAVQIISPQLFAREKDKGGVDPAKGLQQPTPYVANERAQDFMFMVNTSSGVDDVLGQMRLNTGSIVRPLSGFFSDVKYGLMDFSELSNYAGLFPRVNLLQDFQSLTNGGALPSSFENALVTKLSYGGLSGGGVDVLDPHGLAIERGVMRGSWRPVSQKHLVLITDRPLKETYTYNICDSSVQSGFGLVPAMPCSDQPSSTTRSVALGSEICQTIRIALTQKECSFGAPSNPWYIRNISRTIQDAVVAARDKGVTVDVVVPHSVYPGADREATLKQLEMLAESTGGIFLKYDIFNQASYSDMMWQILNHQPQILRLASYDTSSLVDDWSDDVFAPRTELLVKANIPIVLDVSQGSRSHEKYKWDYNNDGTWDHVSSAPNIEHTFKTVQQSGFMTVAAFDGDKQTATLTVPLTVNSSGSPPAGSVTKPQIPNGVSAVLKLDGSLIVSWEPRSGSDQLFVSDKKSGLPIDNTDISIGSIGILNGAQYGDSIKVWVAGEMASSDSLEVIVTKELPPALTVIDPEIILVNSVSIEPPFVVEDIDEPDTPDIPQPQGSTETPQTASFNDKKAPTPEFDPWSQLAQDAAIPREGDSQAAAPRATAVQSTLFTQSVAVADNQAQVSTGENSTSAISSSEEQSGEVKGAQVVSQDPRGDRNYLVYILALVVVAILMLLLAKKLKHNASSSV